MPRPRTEETEIAERRALVSRLYLQGWTQLAIADEVDVDQSTVSRDLDALRQEWRQNAAIDFGEIQARTLASIDLMEAEAWKGWESSRRDREIKTAENSTGRDPKTKTGMRREGQSGDEGYLRTIQWCLEKRMQILGFELPKKIALTNPDGTKEYGTEPGSRPLAALLAGARGALERLGQAAGDRADAASGDQPAVLDAAVGPADAGLHESGG